MLLAFLYRNMQNISHHRVHKKMTTKFMLKGTAVVYNKKASRICHSFQLSNFYSLNIPHREGTLFRHFFFLNFLKVFYEAMM